MCELANTTIKNCMAIALDLPSMQTKRQLLLWRPIRNYYTHPNRMDCLLLGANPPSVIRSESASEMECSVFFLNSKSSRRHRQQGWDSMTIRVCKYLHYLSSSRYWPQHHGKSNIEHRSTDTYPLCYHDGSSPCNFIGQSFIERQYSCLDWLSLLRKQFVSTYGCSTTIREHHRH
jgi:hypothetical protein